MAAKHLNFERALDKCGYTAHYFLDGFHSDVIKLQSQNSEVLRIRTYTRFKINTKLIFVQVSGPEVCFTSKIQQYELPSFLSA